MPVTIGAICDGIAATFEADATLALVRVQSYNQLTEGINSGDCPLLQVYADDGTIDEIGETDRATFGGGVRHKKITINCDLYARQRSHIGEDVGTAIDLISLMIDVLEQQNLKPYFGVVGIQAWSVVWDRVQFDYGSAKFMGARLVITVWVY